MNIIERLSPNRRQRQRPITAIILHDTGGQNAQGTLAWFAKPESGVSSHYLIEKDGTIYRCVPDHDVAWHAGRSQLWHEPDCNSYSLGIELVDNNDKEPYPDEQLTSLITLLTHLSLTYWIPLNRIVGHEHIALPRGRKVDPGPDFPWVDVLWAVGAHVAVEQQKKENP